MGFIRSFWAAVKGLVRGGEHIDEAYSAVKNADRALNSAEKLETSLNAAREWGKFGAKARVPVAVGAVALTGGYVGADLQDRIYEGDGPEAPSGSDGGSSANRDWTHSLNPFNWFKGNGQKQFEPSIGGGVIAAAIAGLIGYFTGGGTTAAVLALAAGGIGLVAGDSIMAALNKAGENHAQNTHNGQHQKSNNAQAEGKEKPAEEKRESAYLEPQAPQNLPYRAADATRNKATASAGGSVVV